MIRRTIMQIKIKAIRDMIEEPVFIKTIKVED